MAISDTPETPSLRATILGSGSSGGVPRPGGKDGHGEWGTCDPENPKNRRTRCSMLLERAHEVYGFDHRHVTSALIDTSPDMRAQLLTARCSRIDGVIYTHAHADQSNGIDDLRAYALSMQQSIAVWIDDETSGELVERFDYCFKQRTGSAYPAILDQRLMPRPGSSDVIAGPAGDINFTPFLQYHGKINSLGFRVGDIAYSSDVVGLPEESFEILKGVKVWIVDALQEKPHNSHAHLELALEWIDRVQPDHAILTNLHVTMDYEVLRRNLPKGVEPAYDGMQIIVPG